MQCNVGKNGLPCVFTLYFLSVLYSTYIQGVNFYANRQKIRAHENIKFEKQVGGTRLR